MSSGFFPLLTLVRHAVKVENRSGLTFFVHMAEADSLYSRVVADSFPQSSSYCSRSHVRYVCKKIGQTIKLSKSSSCHSDDSVATVHVLRSDQ